MAIVQVWSVKSKSHIYALNKQGERGGNRLRCCYLANASLRFTVIVFIGTMPFRVTWYPFVLLTALLSMGWNPPFRSRALNHRSPYTSNQICIGSTQILLVSCAAWATSSLLFQMGERTKGRGKWSVPGRWLTMWSFFKDRSVCFWTTSHVTRCRYLYSRGFGVGEWRSGGGGSSRDLAFGRRIVVSEMSLSITIEFVINLLADKF